MAWLEEKKSELAFKHLALLSRQKRLEEELEDTRKELDNHEKQMADLGFVGKTREVEESK